MAATLSASTLKLQQQQESNKGVLRKCIWKWRTHAIQRAAIERNAILHCVKEEDDVPQEELQPDRHCIFDERQSTIASAPASASATMEPERQPMVASASASASATMEPAKRWSPAQRAKWAWTHIPDDLFIHEAEAWILENLPHVPDDVPDMP